VGGVKCPASSARVDPVDSVEGDRVSGGAEMNDIPEQRRSYVMVVDGTTLTAGEIRKEINADIADGQRDGYDLVQLETVVQTKRLLVFLHFSLPS
jgi:hypothetical protein